VRSLADKCAISKSVVAALIARVRNSLNTNPSTE